MKKEDEEKGKPKKVMRPRKVKLDPLPEDETKTPVSNDEELNEIPVAEPVVEVAPEKAGISEVQNNQQNPVTKQVQQPQGEFVFKKENDNQNQQPNQQNQNQNQ